LVTELKLITPQGKQMVVREQDRDLMRVLRSSFGLLGVVHEVVLRVQPLTPVKIDYQVLGLKEFTARFPAHRVLAGGLASAHLTLRRPHHRRTPQPR
jgi:FAD/FMN-containing dehydrogenase